MSTAPAQTSGWLSNKKFDLFFIFGVMLFALSMGAVVSNDKAIFGLVLVLNLWFLGYHHVISTYTKLGGTQQDKEDNFLLSSISQSVSFLQLYFI